MEPLRINKKEVKKAIENSILDLFKDESFKFRGQTIRSVLSEVYELKEIINPSIFMSQESQEDYPLNKKVPFTGSGKFVFEGRTNGDLMELGEKEYQFSGSASLTVEDNELSATIVDKAITVTPILH